MVMKRIWRGKELSVVFTCLIALALNLSVSAGAVESPSGNETAPLHNLLKMAGGTQYFDMGNDLASGNFPICEQAHDELTLAVAYNSSDNEVHVVWEDWRNVNDDLSGSYAIYGQRVSATGELLGSDFAISTVADRRQLWPALAYNDQANEYLVVWVRWRSIYNTLEDWDWDIWGQLVGSNGTIIGSNFPISTVAGRKRSPAVAYCSSADEYLVVWDTCCPPEAQGFGVFGQRVSSTGELRSLSFLISTAGVHAVHPDLAYNSRDHEYFVVWRDARDYGLNFNDDIYGQRVSCTGELLVEGDIAISTQQVEEGGMVNNGQNGPAVAHNQVSNEYLVVWHDGRNDLNGDESDLDIYGQRVSATGALLDNPGTPEEDETDPAINFPISRATGKQWLPDIAYDGAVNRYVVMWTDWRNGDLNSDIYGQQVSSAGELLGEEFPIADADNNQGNVWFAYDSEEEGGLVVVNNNRHHEYFAAWADYRNESTTGCDIYAWRYELLPFKLFLPIIMKNNS